MTTIESLEELESTTPYRADRNEALPKVLPASWTEENANSIDGGIIQRWWTVSRPDGPMRVAAGVEHHAGRDWLHLSVSRRSRLPSWDDLRLVKRVLAGPERQAIQVIPRDKEYVNLHPNCMHLYVCLGDDPIPSFAVEGLV